MDLNTFECLAFFMFWSADETDWGRREEMPVWEARVAEWRWKHTRRRQYRNQAALEGR